MNIKSAKAKGRKLQNLVRDKLREAFPSLHKDDIKSQTMGMRGQDIVLSPLAMKAIPYAFGCKNVERFQFWRTVEQATENIKEQQVPIVVVKKNNKEPWVAMPLNHFTDLIKE